MYIVAIDYTMFVRFINKRIRLCSFPCVGTVRKVGGRKEAALY